MDRAEQLANGWEADAPVGDTLLRRALHNHASAMLLPAVSVAARVDADGDVQLVDAGPRGWLLNSAVFLRPVLGPDDSVFDRADQLGGVAFAWSATPLPDLRERGWRPEGHPPLMLRPAGGSLPRAPEGLQVCEVTDECVLNDFNHVVVDGYPAPPGTRIAGKAILEEPRFRMWVGYQDGRPVATSACAIACGLNGVTLVATLPEARGRGYGEGMTWRATLADPALPSMLLASDLGRPVYERMGYVAISRFALVRRER